MIRQHMAPFSLVIGLTIGFCAITAQITVCAAAEPEGKEVEYGKYICITDRAVGFQTPEHSTNRYAGSIHPSPDHQKFFATIHKIQKVDSYVDMLQHGIIQHYPERCFSKENIDKLESQWEHGGLNYNGPNVSDFTEWCLAKSAVELKAGNLSTKYYSLNKNVFHDEGGGTNTFWISNGWEFRWSYTDFVGDFYMMEGRCDLIK